MNVELSITEQCNLRCTYCYYRETHAKRCAVMSDEVMEATIRLAVKRSVELQDNFLNITFIYVTTKIIEYIIKIYQNHLKQKMKNAYIAGRNNMEVLHVLSVDMKKMKMGKMNCL